MKKTTIAILSTLLLSSCVSIPTHHEEHKAHWGYRGEYSPSHWGDLKAEYKMCSLGKQQSPINITNAKDTKLKAISFHYTTTPKNIVNNGHTVQVNVNEGSYILIGGKEYALKQFHFHTPSENHINGKSFPLEAHFVHASMDGELAVISVLFEKGKANKTIQALWNNMPMNSGDENELKNIAKNIMDLIPTKNEFYKFNGSLTTPPCSEGVKWMVLSKKLTVSNEQVEKFSKAVHGTNNRPIQATNKRLIER
ncbi:Carbonic anhydrase [hydrothermal vent metagenome]|uniref:carbonic anhydrase n=1 Tax=hydrothermal vent metagenome TaxID=652676 RepID=A0A1W1EJD6_9ZZZZ